MYEALSSRRYVIALLVLALIISVLAWISVGSIVFAAIEPASVTKISDLEVANKIQMTDLTGPTVKTITSNPNGVVTEPRGSLRIRTDVSNVALYQNTDGATAWQPFGTGGSATTSIVIAQDAIASTNFSILGDLDWVAPPNTTDANNNTPGAVHNKRLGGQLYQSLHWMPQTAGGIAGGFTQVGGETWTSTPADDDLEVNLNTTTTPGLFTSTALTNFGFRVIVPATTTQRVLRVYIQHWSSVVTCTARMMNSTAAPITSSHDSGAATNSAIIFRITFTANESTQLYVSVLLTTNHGSSPNMKLPGISLGTS